MPVTGDFAELRRLSDRIRELSERPFQGQVRRVLAQAALTEADLGFRRGEDPNGQPWKPLTSRSGQPLRDTKRLQNSLHGSPSVEGFTIATDVRYAVVHQYGATIKAKTEKGLIFKVERSRSVKSRRAQAGWVRKQQVTIPQRQFMPEGELPEKWSRAFERVADVALRLHIGEVAP